MVETIGISNETGNSFTTTGNITNTGGANILSKGICWSSTSQNPTLADFTTDEGSGTGVFTSELIDLEPNIYYVRAYATNSEGTAYGSVVTFNNILPIVTTASLSFVSHTTAYGGGEVVYEGISATSERGVCWSTSPNPTLNDNFTTNGNGLGTYDSILTGLTEDTTYYIRAYATNNEGTSYGDEIQFNSSGACPPGTNGSGTINLYSQEDVNNFSHTSVFKLIIGDESGYDTSDITDLSPLSCLESVNELTIVGNPHLQNLIGLEGIVTIENNLFIQNNVGLTSLEGLENLQSVGTSSNTSLSLSLFIIFNTSLQDLQGLSSLESVGRTLLIRKNHTLQNLEGLNNLQTVDNLSISINTGLQSLQGIGNLHTITKVLTIHQNPLLTSIDGLSSLTSVGSEANFSTNPPTIEMYTNPLLTNLDILDNFGNGNNIYISACDAVTSIQCPSITQLNGLEIVGNDLLTNLNFSSLNTCVDDGVKIRNNQSLTDFCNFTNYANIAIADPTNCEFTINGNSNNPSVQDIVDGNCN
ncbi:hypothetical protein [Kordia sp.]|uniref:hypothetical protein n=1 Tax=Kordia sp. TaxID=1965332 RepID=UPI003B5BD0A1